MFLCWRNCSLCYLFLLTIGVNVIRVPALSCPDGEFSCADNTKCVILKFVCDGEDDCDDGTDESSCAIRSCLPTEHKCGNGRCILESWKCDKYPDCTDGSDEHENCNNTCAADQFTCYNGYCIPSHYRCDGENDCSDDGEDEKECDTTTCSPGSFHCKNTNRCIDKSFLCDGDNDCGDNSDETSCGKTCKPGTFTCKSGSCIPGNLKCNGRKDCSDGSDEDQCPTVHLPKCNKDEFTCSNGECIMKEFKCDGDKDCTDDSDELGCARITCPSRENLCDNNKCVMKYKLCDGKDDCGDNSDEKSEHCKIPTVAPTELTCKVGEYRCKSLTKCINNSKVCDQKHDCPDNDDESSCSINECLLNNGGCSQLCNDTDNSFYCSCKPGYKLIDDHKTCEVTSTELTCKIGEYRCKSLTKCINNSKVCDQKKDCPDNDDESSCSINECLLNNGGCSQLCNDTDNSFYCLCKPGYKLIDDHKTCEDVDECKILGACTQQCKNMPGSYMCWCMDGYELAPNMKGCLAKGQSPALLVATSMDIRSVSIDGSRLKSIVGKNIKDVIEVAVHYKRNVIFWSDLFLGKIFMATIGGNGNDTKAFATSLSPKGLSVDWVTEKLYWINVLQEGSRIEVAELDGSHHKVLISNIKGEAHSIVVDPVRRYIYWTNPSIPSISRAHMDGHSAEDFIKSNIQSPTGLTIDFTIEMLYWSDSKTHSIESSDLNGNHRRTVITHDVINPFAIAVFEEKLYWTDSVSKTVTSVNKFTGNDRKVVITQKNIASYIPKGILIYHPLKQPQIANSCKKNGGCSHLCLLNPKGYRCACPNNGVLIDGKTCKMPIDDETTTSPTQSISTPTKDSTDQTIVKPNGRDGESKGSSTALIGGIVGGSLILLLIVVVLIVVYRKRNHSRKMEILYNTQLGVNIQSGDAKNPTQGKKDIKDRDMYVKFANKNYKDVDEEEDDDDNNCGENEPVLKKQDDGLAAGEIV